MLCTQFDNIWLYLNYMDFACVFAGCPPGTSDSIVTRIVTRSRTKSATQGSPYLWFSISIICWWTCIDVFIGSIHQALKMIQPILAHVDRVFGSQTILILHVKVCPRILYWASHLIYSDDNIYIVVLMTEEDLDSHRPDEGLIDDYEDDDARVFHARGNCVLYSI